MATKVLKASTGLTGLNVSRDPHVVLKHIYGRISEYLQKMPQNAVYRKYTEQIITERLALVKSEPDIQKLEQKINCGQIEEVILQAQRELQLAKRMAVWKAWEPLIEDVPANQWKWPVV